MLCLLCPLLQCAAAVDNLAGYYFKHMPGTETPAAAAAVRPMAFVIRFLDSMACTSWTPSALACFATRPGSCCAAGCWQAAGALLLLQPAPPRKSSTIRALPLLQSTGPPNQCRSILLPSLPAPSLPRSHTSSPPLFNPCNTTLPF